MKHLIRLSDWDKHDARQVFQMADALRAGKYPKVLEGQTVVLFFPESSIRTRVTFERGIHLLGGQSILFPPSALDKKEDLRDVEGYLSNWAAALVVRHKHIAVTERLAEHADIPVIIAIQTNKKTSSARWRAHGCVVVLGGRQPTVVLRLALHSPSSPPFVSLIIWIAITP